LIPPKFLETRRPPLIPLFTCQRIGHLPSSLCSNSIEALPPYGSPLAYRFTLSHKDETLSFQRKIDSRPSERQRKPLVPPPRNLTYQYTHRYRNISAVGDALRFSLETRFCHFLFVPLFLGPPAFSRVAFLDEDNVHTLSSFPAEKRMLPVTVPLFRTNLRCPPFYLPIFSIARSFLFWE